MSDQSSQSTITQNDNPGWAPHSPAPFYIDKPTLTSNRNVINMAYSGDLLHKQHVRQWFYDVGVMNVTNQDMEFFINNVKYKLYIMRHSPQTMKHYNLFASSNPHHFGTAFEAEYYTNMEFVGRYWRVCDLPSRSYLDNCRQRLDNTANYAISSQQYLPQYFIGNAISPSIIFDRLVNVSQSALNNMGIIDNVILSLRMTLLAITHLWVTMTHPYPDR